MIRRQHDWQGNGIFIDRWQSQISQKEEERTLVLCFSGTDSKVDPPIFKSQTEESFATKEAREGGRRRRTCLRKGIFHRLT